MLLAEEHTVLHVIIIIRVSGKRLETIENGITKGRRD